MLKLIRLLPLLIIVALAFAAPSSVFAVPVHALSRVSAPVVETGPATNIGPRGGIITGVINPRGRIVHYWIAFGRKKPSEHHTGISEERIGGNKPTSVEEVVEKLREGTVYYYRLVAIYEHGTKKAFGAERSFTTK